MSHLFIFLFICKYNSNFNNMTHNSNRTSKYMMTHNYIITFNYTPLKLEIYTVHAQLVRNKFNSGLPKKLCDYICQLINCWNTSSLDDFILYPLLAHRMIVYLNVFYGLVKYMISTLWSNLIDTIQPHRKSSFDNRSFT